MNVLDPNLVEDVARQFRAEPGLIEKDWHVTRAIGALSTFDHGGSMPAFGGGTSLSKAWGLIKRFSEDIDFKVTMPKGASRNRAKRDRSAYRARVLTALTGAGFTLEEEPFKRDENRFFSVALFYEGQFSTGPGLRPHIRIEMSLTPPTLAPVTRPVSSLIALAQGQPPEVTAFLCVDPVETAADKLSALAWRVHARHRGSDNDDPTIIRHLHDLAALKASAAASGSFIELVGKARAEDVGRGGEAIATTDPATLFAGMIERLSSDPLWAREYEEFVDAVSFAAPAEQIGFADALATLTELVALCTRGGGA
jgi:hypothetical protein